MSSGWAAARQLLERDVDGSIPSAPALLQAVSKLTIRDKQKRERLLSPNAVQRDLAEQAFRGHRRLLVLKARQVGVSTFTQGWIYTLTTSERFTRAVTVSHEADATARLAGMQKFFKSRDPRNPETTTNRVGEVTYRATEATHYIGTAGARAFGRGDTLHFVHCSELAFWPDAERLLTGLLEGVPIEEGRAVIESTPNGMGGHFYELWQGAPENGWKALFYPWWWETGYRIRVQDDEVLPLREDEQRLVDEHGLDLEQIAWRREKQRSLRDKFPQEYPENPIDCFLVSGRPYFDISGLQAQERHLEEPIRSDGRGLDVWRAPVPGHQYAIAADPAEGLEGGDFSVAQVLDMTTGEQAARLRGLWPTDHFAKLLVELAGEYLGAVIAPERNNHGHAVISSLRNELHYGNIYRHFEYDPLMSAGDEKHRWGWPTTTTTKPVMLSDLDAALGDEGGIRIHDRVTLGELRTMHWDGKGGVGAINGCHDDCAMAVAIAWQLRKRPGGAEQAIAHGEGDLTDEQRKAADEYYRRLQAVGVPQEETA